MPVTAQNAAMVLARLRKARPRIHCLTNQVAQEITANALLALGAIPSMTSDPDEVGAFVAGAQGLLVNLGTMDQERRRAISQALDVAGRARLPWVLDPVLIERSQVRAVLAGELMMRRPSAARMNGVEFEILSQSAVEPEAVRAYAHMSASVIAVSGAQDIVSDGAQIACLANGHEWMTRVTALGCAQSALIAAACAVEDNAFVAAASAVVWIGVAGEIAAAHARGPGTFAGALLDALYHLDDVSLMKMARIS